ncbi:SUMF1/EgtB/PvdO family nonheme iron enzyme [Flagellimonas sp. S174]|uniref:SUMF1/EgtB/PvdO family nonheme iron enzyme n=1 Tax=Flagellimonas sp. S174 TaxID=3410790 RepID=UPI003BF59A68
MTPEQHFNTIKCCNLFLNQTQKNSANWKHPNGPGSDIDGKENHPVVHVAFEDALAYCQWAGKEIAY